MPHSTLSDRFARPRVSWLEECRAKLQTPGGPAAASYVPRRLRDHSRKSKMCGIVF